MADHHTRASCRPHRLGSLRLAVIAAVLGWWSWPAAAQMRPEPSGLMPPGAGGDSAAAAPEAAIQPADASQEQEMVVDVRVAGNKSVPLAKILPSIRTRADRPFNLEQIAEDVRRLDQTRMFVDVQTYYQRVVGGIVVIFDVVERPLVQDVKYIGCRKITKKTLAKETNLKPGDSLDPFSVEEARRKIEELYRKRGFAGARITIIEGNKTEDRRVVFYINEGTKQKVRKLYFIGNTIASDGRLKTQIKSKPPFLYLFKGELDRAQLDEDVERLEAYYRGLGFFRARIGRELNYNEKKDWVTVTFVIDEGPRHKIREIAVQGNKKYASDVLMAELKLRGGEYYNQAKMYADKGALQDKYGGVGYVFADVKPDIRMLEDPGQIDLIYHIEEGEPFRVGKINIRIKGEYPHTQLATVRYRLSFKPGDIIDIREIRASERRLRACGLFESNPAGGQAPKIVFNPPGQKFEEKEEVAERPKDAPRRGEKDRDGSGRGMGPGMGRGMGGNDDTPSFRGQSPDAMPREKVLDVTLDFCEGREERGEGRGERAGKTIVLCGTDETPRDCAAGGERRRMAAAGRATAASAQTTAGVSADTRPSKNNFAVLGGDPPSPPAPLPKGEGSYCRSAANDSDARLQRAARDLTDVLAQHQRRRRTNDIILTQYSPNAGQVNPAALPQSNYAAPATQSQGVSPANNSYTSANGAYSTAAGSASAVPPTQAAPVQPAEAYGNQMRPRQGATRPVETPEGSFAPGPIFDESSPFIGGPVEGGDVLRTLDFEVMANEAMTGRMMFGVGINSDAGLVGQIVIDEQNFDWTRFPRSWEDIRNGKAFRGNGQRFRIEAVPGTELQRYMVTFQDPYFLGSQISLGLSGYFYNRSYTEWFEQRIGGRIALGYQFTPDLSGSIAYRGAKVNITDVIDPTLPVFQDVLGRSLALHGFALALSRDKRDNAFLATEGHLIEATVEQVIGSYSYPRAEIDLRKYFTLYERPDGSGRHVLSLAGKAGYTGDDTPIYEHFFAGGFSSLRGFEFRGASPHVYSNYVGYDVFVGGQFQLLASAEYMFPITADDMIRGVVFCDTGTVEPKINDWSDRYRVAPGFGLRISVPAMGPAPIALDFAFPISWQPGDRFEVFSFFVGFGR